MTIDRNRSKTYAYNRPFYEVDPNATINAGMVAFLAANGAGNVVATTAPSGTVPVGVFWKDHNTGYLRTALEQHTFNAAGNFAVLGGNMNTAASVKVTHATSGAIYVQGTDYNVTIASGLVTRIAGGAIAAGETVIVWYEYSITAAALMYSGGTNYDRVPDDTLGSGQIVVIHPFAIIYTDQFDPTNTYQVNTQLFSDTASKWTTSNAAGFTSNGRCVQVPTVNSNFLGIELVAVTA